MVQDQRQAHYDQLNKAKRLHRIKEAGPELLEKLKQTVTALEYWFPRWGDPEGANSQMMKNARALISRLESEP